MPPTVTLTAPTEAEIAEGRVSPATPLQFLIQPATGESVTGATVTVSGTVVYSGTDGINGWYGTLRTISAPIIPPPLKLTLYSPNGFEYGEDVTVDVDVAFESGEEEE